MMDTNIRILRRSLTLRPFDDVSDGTWRELTDPANFVVGSFLMLLYRPRSAAPSGHVGSDPSVDGQLLGRRFGATLIVAFVVALPALIGLLFPGISTGDPFAYALTLLVLSTVTLIPGRVADLRREGRVCGSGYPKTLRKVMWYAEYVLFIAGVIVMTVWQFGGPGNHETVRAVVWGLLAVCAAEFETLIAARSIAIGEAVLAEEGETAPEIGGAVESAPTT